MLVDELAHTNAEGSRHPKRYQDIEELLENGIDVHTAVNIQYFESMNDSVAKITGVRMQETLPSISYFFFPIKSQEETIGMLGVKYDYKNLLPEQRRILGTISNFTSLTAARWVRI